jgi:ribosomal protein S6--L-glutamate ligase
VDLLDVKGSPKVFEVNSSPALTEMEAATGMDLASKVIERAEQLVAASGRELAVSGSEKREALRMEGVLQGRPATKASEGRG